MMYANSKGDANDTPAIGVAIARCRCPGFPRLAVTRAGRPAGPGLAEADPGPARRGPALRRGLQAVHRARQERGDVRAGSREARRSERLQAVAGNAVEGGRATG